MHTIGIAGHCLLGDSQGMKISGMSRTTSEDSAAEVDLLARAIERDLGLDPSRWFSPRGYDSVALAVLDSIYSTGNRYTSVVNALDKYRVARRAEGADPNSDTASDLVEATDRWGGIDALVANTNRCRTSTKKTAPFKAEAAYHAARILADHGLNTRAGVHVALIDPELQEGSPVKAAWRDLPGQSSLLTWTYFLMLCGVPGVKADRMVVAYVSRALGRPADSKRSASLVGQVADRIAVNRTKLDHAIWRKESNREVYLDGSSG